MSKCGKSCMPECEYFTTGGCVSPFNCSYKIEEISPNSATSINDTFVQGLITENERLKSENAALRERLEKAVELPCKLGANLFTIEKHYEFITYGAVEYRVENKYCAGEIVVCEDGRFCFYTPTYNPKCLVFGEDIFTTREAAEARLAELKGETK